MFEVKEFCIFMFCVKFMKNNDTFLSLIFGVLSLISWLFPSLDIKIKIIISVITISSVLFIFFREKLSFFLRKNWQIIISLTLLATSFLLFRYVYPELLLPALIILLTSVSISLLLIFKYRQPLVYKTKELIQTYSMDLSWTLNHWGGNCASIVDNKMIFSGTSVPNETDGSHKDFLNILMIGATYEIECYTRSAIDTTGRFQLWCHDKNSEPNGVSKSTEFKTPSIKGEMISLIFKAEFNQGIRIHLQYSPGEGQIEVDYVNINKLIT
jgi:hypothetical protein